MEGDEMELSKEELQRWIREEVKKNGLISSDVMEKCSLLQSLLERRERQAAQLRKLCESVAACEAIVKKQYSLLGWEYRDTDSDDDKIAGCGNTLPSRAFVQSEVQVPSPPTANDPTPLPLKLEHSDNDMKSIILKRQPVVVLTRLSTSMIRSLRLRTPQNHYIKDESVNNLDIDVEWKQRDDSSDSYYSTSSYNTGSNKKRKIDRKYENLAKSHATPQASTNSHTKRNAVRTSTPKANGNTNGNCKAMKKSKLPANTNATKTPTSVPQGEIRVNMNVLARKRAVGWKHGKVVEIVTKEDGRLKYKINFEEKGKSLVSAHHIALVCMPKAKQLFVGARVVVKHQDDPPQYCPGIVAEVPSSKNCMRFLVLTDDHTPVYVGLPLLYLVFKPLKDPLDDIPDGAHKNFMKGYIKAWPYPPQVRYRVGQTINAELDGAQQKCEVQLVDCSLIHVVFQRDQRKEWIYRGSMRLEHMINMKETLDVKNKEEH